MDSYRTLQKTVRAELQRERSRFIAIASLAENRDSISSQLRLIKDEFPDATHHCYAYRLIEKNHINEFAEDAGEPLGSAGRPILQVLAGRELLNTLVVVVRYFGGVKLGVGGLIRAYSDATKLALEAASIIVRIRELDLVIRYSHNLTGEVMRTINRFGAQILKLEYAEKPQARLRLGATKCDAFCQELRDATRGQVELLESIS
jgi:uncharacterized YigZ family protein